MPQMTMSLDMEDPSFFLRTENYVSKKNSIDEPVEKGRPSEENFVIHDFHSLVAIIEREALRAKALKKNLRVKVPRSILVKMPNEIYDVLGHETSTPLIRRAPSLIYSFTVMGSEKTEESLYKEVISQLIKWLLIKDNPSMLKIEEQLTKVERGYKDAVPNLKGLFFGTMANE